MSDSLKLRVFSISTTLETGTSYLRATLSIGDVFVQELKTNNAIVDNLKSLPLIEMLTKNKLNIIHLRTLEPLMGYHWV